MSEVALCHSCGEAATQAVRFGLEWNPICDECAKWWRKDRLRPLDGRSK